MSSAKRGFWERTGEQPVMSLDGVAEAGTVETRLRDILSSSKAVNERASALLDKEKADAKADKASELNRAYV